MSKVIDYFKEICKIPHGSYHTDELQKHLVDFAKSRGFKVEVDEAGNIYAFKGEPKICLQSHYDMVCVGLAPNIEIIQKDGFLSAKDSSLGADNGIGVAIMLSVMDEFSDIEMIFTNNEEVGLWGVSQCEFKIKSKKLLNLDSEEDDRVTIGCAGSVDINAQAKIEKVSANGYVYELDLTGLKGGHSGIQIADGIKNAIKILAWFIRENGGKLVKFNGGERRNSIAANAHATVLFDNELKASHELIKSNFLGKKEVEIYKNSDEILNILNIFSQGVRDYNKELNLPQTSANLSLAKEEDDAFKILLFPRSMSSEGLENVKFETEILCKINGFDVSFSNQTTPWNPTINEFSKAVLKNLQKFKPDAKFSAVHAGLECGVFIAKDPTVLATSIGPNIYSPHSVHEKVELKSVDIISNAVNELLKDLGCQK
ncbi:M20/M25/M40 family metallo-hydrolase [Campylobacter corcagiensis]|uniref:M20/M25/M40 family metallo-hydrolase n=1 Tax=Campylobacter corcagiensis TaxID=1448857 RepID=A0A7M1LEW0_9BACT|nr:M20/M25/M40 family metallo-hydrolase [Campylobacter corcagiensis]QKF64860.1 peptidase D [Campylobacter corcagiensis]QOQ86980.1 M20/M25/M40 family metallo-hydrolase [Campylobacter corcagiensis]